MDVVGCADDGRLGSCFLSRSHCTPSHTAFLSVICINLSRFGKGWHHLQFLRRREDQTFYFVDSFMQRPMWTPKELSLWICCLDASDDPDKSMVNVAERLGWDHRPTNRSLFIPPSAFLRCSFPPRRQRRWFCAWTTSSSARLGSANNSSDTRQVKARRRV